MKRFYDIYRPQRSPDDIRPMSHYFRSPDISFSPFTKIGHLADAGEMPDTAPVAQASKPAPKPEPTASEPDYTVPVEHKKAVFPAGFKLPETTAVDPPIPQTTPRKIPVLTPADTFEPATAAASTRTATPKSTGLISEFRHAAGRHLRKRPRAYSARENSAPILVLTSQRMKGIGLLLTSVLLIAVLGYSGASDEQSGSSTPSRVSPKPTVVTNASSSVESTVTPVDTSALTTPVEDTSESQAAPTPPSSRRTTHRATLGSDSQPPDSSEATPPADSQPAPESNPVTSPPDNPPADSQPETPVVTDPPVTPTDPTPPQPELPPPPSTGPVPTPTVPITTEPETP